MQMVPPHAIGTLIASNALGTDLYMPPPQENNSTSIPGEASALHLAWHTSGYSRFLFGMYAALGIIFFGIAIFSALDILMGFLSGNSISFFQIALPFCYVLLNAAIGYGFIFYQKWLLVAFLGIFGLKVSLASIYWIKSHQLVLPISFFVVAGILTFLFVTKNLLFGKHIPLRTIVPFTVILLVSFFLGNFSVLH